MVAADIRSLPRAAYAGPEYYADFRKANDAGWTDPNFFPIGAWWSTVTGLNEAPSQLKWDRDAGFNTWIMGTAPSAAPTAQQFADAGMFYIGKAMNDTFNESATHWVGTIIKDEIDADFLNRVNQQKMPVQDALNATLAEMTAGADADHAAGLMRYANFGFTIAGNDMPTPQAAEALVNQSQTDVHSITSYPYSSPWAQRPFNITEVVTAPEGDAKVSATSYGCLSASLQAREVAGGKDVPTFGFVEAYDGGVGGTYPYILPRQMKGAAWNHLIRGARGIVWFLQDYEATLPENGGKLVTNVLRQAQWGNAKYIPNVDAMREVNLQITRHAAVLNSPTVVWDAGVGVDSMLKVYNGYAYMFVMAAAGLSGERTFNLPSGIAGTAEVVDEGRTVTINNDTITETFIDNADYHIYKIALQSSAPANVPVGGLRRVFTVSSGVLAPAPVDPGPVWKKDRATRIHCMGDSITEGYGAKEQGGYRLPLQTLLQQAGKNVEFVGTRNDTPGPNTWWSGGGGWKIEYFTSPGTANWTGKSAGQWLKDVPSDIVLLHIGTNNQSFNYIPLEETAKRYAGLLDMMWVASPKTHFFLANPRIDQPLSWKKPADLDKLFMDAIKERQDKGMSLHVVTGMDEVGARQLLVDQLHPNVEGYNLMAQRWADALLANQ